MAEDVLVTLERLCKLESTMDPTAGPEDDLPSVRMGDEGFALAITQAKLARVERNYRNLAERYLMLRSRCAKLQQLTLALKQRLRETGQAAPSTSTAKLRESIRAMPEGNKRLSGQPNIHLRSTPAQSANPPSPSSGRSGSDREERRDEKKLKKENKDKGRRSPRPEASPPRSPRSEDLSSSSSSMASEKAGHVRKLTPTPSLSSSVGGSAPLSPGRSGSSFVLAAPPVAPEASSRESGTFYMPIPSVDAPAPAPVFAPSSAPSAPSVPSASGSGSSPGSATGTPPRSVETPPRWQSAGAAKDSEAAAAPAAAAASPYGSPGASVRASAVASRTSSLRTPGPADPSETAGLKKGYMMKLTKTLAKKCWFMLLPGPDGAQLFWKLSEKVSVKKGGVLLRGGAVNVVPAGTTEGGVVAKPFTISIKPSRGPKLKTYLLCAATQDEMISWLDALQAASLDG